MPGRCQLLYLHWQPDAGRSKIVVLKVACLRIIILEQPLTEIQAVLRLSASWNTGVEEIMGGVEQVSVEGDFVGRGRPRRNALGFMSHVYPAVPKSELVDTGTIAENSVQHICGNLLSPYRGRLGSLGPGDSQRRQVSVASMGKPNRLR